MKNISTYITILLIFFLGSGGIVYIMSDIGIKNSNLNDDAKITLGKLETYKLQEEKIRFDSKNIKINYSLTGYETIDPLDKQNVESKGFWTKFLTLKDSLSIIPILLSIILPFDILIFWWAIGIFFGAIGFYFAIAWWKAWKAGQT